MKIFAVQTPLLDGHQNVGPGIWIEKDIFQKKEKIGKFLKYVKSVITITPVIANFQRR